jgi:hypothetical protein
MIRLVEAAWEAFNVLISLDNARSPSTREERAPQRTHASGHTRLAN